MPYTTRWKLRLKHGTVLPAGGSPLEVPAGDNTLIEGGAAVTFDMREALDAIVGYTLTIWSDLNIGAIGVGHAIKYRSSADSFSGLHTLIESSPGEVRSSDFTISTNLSNGRLTIALKENTTTEDYPVDHATYRYFLEVTLQGSDE